MGKLLWTLREHRDLSIDLWRQFKEKAAQHGHRPTGALSRLIRRYLAKGFDDGQKETREGDPKD